MSSPSSVQTPPAEGLAAGLSTVAERSFFAYAEPAAADRAAGVEGAWYRASVEFRGPFDGCVTMALPAGLARELCAAFLGAEPDELDEAAVRDLAGEFVNMTCGTWLTGLTQAHASWIFDLAHPEVEAAAGTPAGDFVMTVNDQPVVVALRPGTAS